MTLLAALGVVVRWVIFAAVLAGTGAAAFRFLVLPRVPRSAFTDRAAARAARTAALCAAIGLVFVGLRLPLQVAELRDASIPLLPQVQALGLHTMWGAVWLYQLATIAVCAAALWVARGGSTAAWVAAGVASVLLAVAPALGGHAIASERLSGAAVVSDALHVIAAGAWLGGMLAVLVTLALARHERVDGSGSAAAIVAAFSPIALLAAALVLATGVFAAWLHVGTFAALWQSRYGITLSIKVLAVLLMAGAGAWNWKRAGPALRESGDATAMWRSVRAELWLGALVILATAVLVALPQPGQE